jgi:anti-anti-sigma factor
MTAQSALQCIPEYQRGAALVMCPSDLSRGQENQLLSLVLPIIEDGSLLLDMSRVDSIDAGGIGTLVYLRQCANQSGASLAIINPSDRVREMLALVHLDGILLAA